MQRGVTGIFAEEKEGCGEEMHRSHYTAEGFILVTIQDRSPKN